MMPCPFSEKHLPSQATGLALLPARKATPGPGSGSCCARGVSALWSSTKVPVAANLKLKPQPKPEELATERTLRPLRKQRASPPGQLFFWILKKADDFPTPTMPISRRGRKPSVRQDFAPVPIAQACPSRKSPACPLLPRRTFAIMLQPAASPSGRITMHVLPLPLALFHVIQRLPQQAVF